MKIAIVSDIHDNITNLQVCLDWCREKELKKIICLGDITNEDSLKKLAEFQGEVFLIKGNADIYDFDILSLYENITYLGRTGVVKVAGINIGLCHEPYNEKYINKNNLKIIFYGHTHKPWIEDKNGIKYVNPGTLSGMFASATFAYWEPEKGELELLQLGSLA